MLFLFGSAIRKLRSAAGYLGSFLIVRIRRLPLVIKGALALYGCLTLTMFGVLHFAQLGTQSKIYELPQAYLPGNPLPATVAVADCSDTANKKFSTLAEVDGRSVYLTYVFEERKIIRASVRAEDYNIGELITAWGRPTGIEKHGTTVLVSWGLRSVTLYTSFFNPSHPVAFIAYDNNMLNGAAWRGFMNKMQDHEVAD